MHASAILTALLTVLPLASAGRGKLGFSLGSKNGDGSCKHQNDYELDFDAISKSTDARIVRGYAASECDFAKEALPAAKKKGFQVILGIWYA